jgi:solute carrier family 25 carnitine/acylcarnitine transporter 20/29
MDNKNVSPAKNFLAGGFGGMCLVFAGHPFDTVKVRLQTMALSSTNTAVAGPVSVGQLPGYSGAFDCFKKTLVTEGVTGFYKGMGTPLLMVSPMFALGFFTYGLGKKIATYTSSAPANTLLTPTQLFCAGAFSGTIASFVVAPVERIKCLLQVQVNEGSGAVRKYAGPTHCATALLKEGGLPNLYKGFGATFLRGIPQAGLYFMTYEVLKRSFVGDDKSGKLSPGKTLLAGGLTGIINWTFVLPLDVVKSRIQTAAKGQYPRGFRDALPQLVRTEGVKGLFRGIVPVFLRAFPANAACFMGFETFMKFLNWVAPEDF